MHTAAVITVSDRCYAGTATDTSGPGLCQLLQDNGYEIVSTALVPDEKDRIQKELLHCADELGVHLILTTGGTGFSPRDVTPEATKTVLAREVPGIPEAMRAESMHITPRGCLSREIAGIRGNTLIINLPGSKKASQENLLAVLPALAHGLDTLTGTGSADHTAPEKKYAPSADAWLREAKAACAGKAGMFLLHNGVVRETARAAVREGRTDLPPVSAMVLQVDRKKAEEAAEETRQLPGVCYVRTWLNDGPLSVGDDIMLVLVAGDTRPHTVAALEHLVGRLKAECVSEREIYQA